MSDVEKVETTESTIDRKELLAQQFDEVEQAPAERVRDEAGKFAKADAPKIEQAPEAEPPVWKRPPASWKKDYHELWNTADDRLKEYAYQREEQMRRGVEPLLSKAQFADAMQTAIEPYMNTIRGLGLEPHQAVSALMQADQVLRTGTPEQKAAYFQQLGQQYGIDLSGSAPSVPQNQYAPLLNEINSIRGELMGWKQQQEAVQNQTLLGEIDRKSTRLNSSH